MWKVIRILKPLSEKALRGNVFKGWKVHILLRIFQGRGVIPFSGRAHTFPVYFGGHYRKTGRTHKKRKKE